MSSKKIVDAEDITSWPAEVLNLLNSVPKHVLGRSSDLLNAVTDYDLLGFHCTRLLNDEIAEIRSNGMVPLSSTHLEKRIQNRINQGEISDLVGRQLITLHQAQHIGRRGKICFVGSKSTLQKSSAVHRLFRSWGGEALYNSHERLPTTGPLLRSIGTPCIVIVALKIRNCRLFFPPMPDFFIQEYAYQEQHHDPDLRTGLDVFTEQAVAANEIMSIVKLGEARFEELTKSESWTYDRLSK